MSPIQDFSALPSEKGARVSQSSRFEAFVTLSRTVGCFARSYLRNQDQRASLDSAMPIPLTHPLWFEALKCALRRPVRSIALYARPMESGFAQSKNLDISLRRPSGLETGPEIGPAGFFRTR